MSDLKLNLETGDLDLDGGSLKIVTGAAAVVQRLFIRFRFFKGEWFLNREEGVPYAEILGEKPTQAVIEALFRKVITTCPGVVSLDFFSAERNNDTRELRIRFSATVDNGELIDFDRSFII